MGINKLYLQCLEVEALIRTAYMALLQVFSYFRVLMLLASHL